MSKILIVDDDSELAQLLATKLQALGETCLAETGYQAIALLEKGGIDLVVSDYNMQDGDGGSLAHYCVNRQIPIIVVSSFAEAHIKPYLPANVSFLNKFSAIRGEALVDTGRQCLHRASA